MGNKNNKKKEPWRMIVGMISFAFIAYMWVKKDISSIYTTMPSERVVPFIVLTITVSLIKLSAIAGISFLIKWIIGKITK